MKNALLKNSRESRKFNIYSNTVKQWLEVVIQN